VPSCQLFIEASKEHAFSNISIIQAESINLRNFTLILKQPAISNMFTKGQHYQLTKRLLKVWWTNRVIGIAFQQCNANYNHKMER